MVLILTVVGSRLNQNYLNAMETSSRHTEHVQEEEAAQEEHVYDYIQDTDEDLQLEENVAYNRHEAFISVTTQTLCAHPHCFSYSVVCSIRSYCTQRYW